MKKSLLFIFLTMLLIAAGCQSKNFASAPPAKPLVPKPDEIYVGTPKYLTRVKENSPWFNAYWTITDKAVKATQNDTRPQGVRMFEMSSARSKEPPSDKAGRFLRYKSYLPEPLKEGQTILTGATMAKGEEEASIYLALWYRKLQEINVGEEPPKGYHLLETQQLGYPVKQDGTHVIRQLFFDTPRYSKDSKEYYSLDLQGTQKVKSERDDNYYYGAAHDQHLIDMSKYSFQDDLVKTYEKFRKTEVKISEEN